jgi:hypothetical protein
MCAVLVVKVETSAADIEVSLKMAYYVRLKHVRELNNN